ncbi:MAG: SRPBCC family protein [Planctomycetota bacterium]
MPIIRLRTEIAARRGIVFDLSRSIDLHVESTSRTKEQAVAGRTKGLIQEGESVTWEATHFGFRQRLTSKITQFDRPNSFRDSMVAGAFKRFDHDHLFEEHHGGTVLIDVFDYTSPLGALGRFADLLFLKRYMTNLLRVRNKLIREVAESGDANRYLNAES